MWFLQTGLHLPQQDETTQTKHLVIRAQNNNAEVKKKKRNQQLLPSDPPLVNDLQVSPLEEVAGARWTGQHQHQHVSDHLLLLPLRCWREPFLQSQLPLSTEQQQEVHLGREDGIGAEK